MVHAQGRPAIVTVSQRSLIGYCEWLLARSDCFKTPIQQSSLFLTDSTIRLLHRPTDCLKEWKIVTMGEMIRSAHSGSVIGGETPAADGAWIDREITPFIDSAKRAVVDAFTQARERWDAERSVMQGNITRQQSHIDHLETEAVAGEREREHLHIQVKELQTRLAGSERRKAEMCDAVKTFLGENESERGKEDKRAQTYQRPPPSTHEEKMIDQRLSHLKPDPSPDSLASKGPSIPHTTVTTTASTSASTSLTVAQSTNQLTAESRDPAPVCPFPQEIHTLPVNTLKSPRRSNHRKRKDKYDHYSPAPLPPPFPPTTNPPQSTQDPRLKARKSNRGGRQWQDRKWG